jgi:hypothetical protein
LRELVTPRGPAGLDRFNKWSDLPAHRAAQKLFLERSKDPAFREAYCESYDNGDFRDSTLVASYPDQALPCAALRAEHKYECAGRYFVTVNWLGVSSINAGRPSVQLAWLSILTESPYRPH